MKILVTGGAGYIGSITARELNKLGHKVVIYDSLENGHRQAVKQLKLVKGKIQDAEKVARVLKKEKIEAVIHFAAFIEMGESMEKPDKYFENNVFGSLQLLKAMVDAKVNKLVFSSTAGVYGNPKRIPIKETDRCLPENPYGQSKLMIEQMLRFFDQTYGLRSIAIRYFNAAGASLDGTLGEAHKPESHLIPSVIRAVINSQEFSLFGDDYSTKDGTCVRDYIHVLDLAETHILALKALQAGHKTDVYNAGTGKGYSNKEVVEMVKKVSSKDITVKIDKRRPGDANELVADSSKLKKELNWQPRYSDLKTIVETAWKWHSTYPSGYCS